MEKNLRTELAVNNVSIELNPFVEEFLTRTVIGAVSSLKGAEYTQNLELHLEQGDVKLIVNGNELHLTPFAKDIITNTIIGLVSSLKGVDKIDSLKINVKAE
ncbi:MAG: hypothetical protein DRN49_06625 [Thaumarchaeota archaeon]|nr:MAG: hypothetical protein DRN49_06625 [Nitrososphaerota archaeon]